MIHILQSLYVQITLLLINSAEEFVLTPQLCWLWFKLLARTRLGLVRFRSFMAADR